jgi:hypothetical protein
VRIIIESIAGGDPERLRMFLVGTALSVLCLQRGLLPLHAGAIEAGRRAIAFAGGSGAGKSTLCAHFENGGYNILSDDVCMIDVRRDHSVVWPGLPRMRLRRDAAALLERNLADAARQDEPALGLAPFHGRSGAARRALRRRRVSTSFRRYRCGVKFTIELNLN